MKYERRRVEGFSIRFELFDDALDALTDQQLGQVIRATRKFAEADGNGQAMTEQPNLDPQARLAFNLLKRSVGYSNQARKQNNFTSKFNKDFSDVYQTKDGERVAPELIAKQFTDEQLMERGYTPDEIKMIHTRIENYEAKIKAREELPARKKGGKVVTETKYDQRENTENDINAVPDWLKKLREQNRMEQNRS